MDSGRTTHTALTKASSGNKPRPKPVATTYVPNANLKQRVTEIVEHGEAEEADNDSEYGSHDEEQPLEAMFSILNMKQDDFEGDIRVVIVPAAGVELSEADLGPAHDIGAAETVLVIRQSSKTTDFTMNLGKKGLCRFYYDVASDGLVASNEGRTALYLQPVEAAAESLLGAELPARGGACPVSPGYWRLVAQKDDEALVEFLLLRRRYVATIASAITPIAGSKRRVISHSPAGNKRLARAIRDDPSSKEQQTRDLVGGPDAAAAVDAREDQQDTVVISTVSKVASTEVIICNNDNPLLACTQTNRFSVRSPDMAAHAGESITRQTSTSETYSITNIRDVFTRDVTAVFRATHTSFGEVIVKIIKTGDYMREEGALHRLTRKWQREIKFVEYLDHPSIVKFYASDARFFSVFMEYLPYPDLLRQCDRRGVFRGSEADARRVLSDMASALSHLEDKQIMHNDIKPANIVYHPDRGAVLIDFGLACEVGVFTNAGTAHYIPPEVLDFDRGYPERSLKSDIFSLGVSALYLLRKIRLPEAMKERWPCKDRVAAREWLIHVNRVRESLGAANKIEKLVSQMLEPKPKDRITARELLAGLRLPDAQ